MMLNTRSYTYWLTSEPRPFPDFLDCPCTHHPLPSLFNFLLRSGRLVPSLFHSSRIPLKMCEMAWMAWDVPFSPHKALFPALQATALFQVQDISFDTSILLPNASTYTFQGLSRLSMIDESPLSQWPTAHRVISIHSNACFCNWGSNQNNWQGRRWHPRKKWWPARCPHGWKH